MESIDPVYEVSGTLGITGAADTVLVLKKERRKSVATLFTVGRDIEDQEIALELKDGIRWIFQGNADEFNQSDARKEILAIIRESPDPISPKEIAEKLNKNSSTTRGLIRKMEKEGVIKKDGYGKYVYNPRNNVNSINSVNS